MPYTVNPFTGELDYYKDLALTYVADTGFAKAADNQLIFKGDKGVVTSGDEDTLTFALDDSIARFFKTDDDELTVAVEGILHVHGQTPIHTKAGDVGQYVIFIDNATKDSVGVAKFSAPYFVVDDGDVSILDATYSTKGISQFDQETFIVDKGMVTSVIATETTRGIAAFQDPVFTIIDGNVTLKPSTATTLGVASFDDQYFIANEGAITCIEDIVKNPKFTADDQNFALVSGNVVIFSGLVGIKTQVVEQNSNKLCIGITGDVQQFFKCNDLSVNSALDNQMEISGLGPVKTTTPSAGILHISCDLATTTTPGIASFDETYFSVVDGLVKSNAATSTSLGVASFDTTGFTVTDGHVTLTLATDQTLGIAAFPDPFIVQDGFISIKDATSTEKGISSFDQDQFTLSSGNVQIVSSSSSVKGISSFSNAYFSVYQGDVSIKDATSSSKGISSFDETGFTLTSGNVSLVAATTTTRGVASFASDYFAVTDGAVTINDASTSRKGVAKFDDSGFVVNQGVVSLITASTAALGVSSFDPTQFQVSNGAVTLINPGSGTQTAPMEVHPSFVTQNGTAQVTNDQISIIGTTAISTSVPDPTNNPQVINVNVQTADDQNLGVASFTSADFTCTTGAVSLNTVPVTKGGTGATNFKSNGAVLSSYSNSPLYASPSFDTGTLLGQGTAEIRPLYAQSNSDFQVNFDDDFVYFVNPNPGFKWQGAPYSQSATTVQPGYAYITNSSGSQSVTFTLGGNQVSGTSCPSIKLIGGGLNNWSLDLNGSSVRFGNTLAVTRIASTTPYDSLELTYVSGFQHRYVVTGSQGNFSIT